MTTPVTPVPDASLPLPDPADLGTWGARMAEMHRWMREELRGGMNSLADQTYTNAMAAVAAANFKGDWAGLTGALAIPASASHAGSVWMLLSTLADVTTETPGVSAEWMDIMPLKAADIAMLATTQLGFRNKVVNGNFAVNQGGVSGTVVLAAGAYGHDQWKAGASGCTYTFSSSEGVTTLTISAGSLIQPIEGASLRTGTYTLSWTGTAQGKIGAGSYGASGLTGSITGGANTTIEFNTGTIALVQLERGDRATVFEFLDPTTDLLRCQRYYEKGAFQITGNHPSSAGFGGTAYYKVPKRVSPTVTASYSNVNVLSMVTSGSDASQIRFFGSGGAGAVQISANWTANARM